MTLRDKLFCLALVLLSIGLLYPGVSKPVMTISATLDRAGMVDIGQQAIVDARVQKALAKNPDKNEEKLRHRKARTVRFLSGIMDLDEVSGRVEVYRKSSSVRQTVQTLVDKGYVFVAALVALFSVIIPVLKNLMLVVAVFAAQSKVGKALLKAASLLAKWSMADVFLVALFVGFLAFNATSAMSGVLEMNAQVESGLYWFTAYCVISIVAGQIISHKLNNLVVPKRKKTRAKAVR